MAKTRTTARVESEPAEKPAELLMEWAKALTPERLASDLQRIADVPRAFGYGQRRALIHEAARRILSNGVR